MCIILCRLVDQDAWARQQAESQGNSSDFWAATGLVLRQFDGLHAGYVNVLSLMWRGMP